MGVRRSDRHGLSVCGADMRDFQCVTIIPEASRKVFGDKKMVADSIVGCMDDLQKQADEALHVPVWGSLRTKVDGFYPSWVVTCTVTAAETVEAYEQRTGKKVQRGY